MAVFTVELRLALPDEGPNLDDLRAMAEKLGITLDQFAARAMCALHEESEIRMEDPRMKAWTAEFEASRKMAGGKA